MPITVVPLTLNCFHYLVTLTCNFTSSYINKHEKQPKSCETNIDEKPEGNFLASFLRSVYAELCILIRLQRISTPAIHRRRPGENNIEFL